MESQDIGQSRKEELIEGDIYIGPQGAQDEEPVVKYPHLGTLCLHTKTCQREIGESFLNNFARGFAIKLLLRLITERSFKSIRKSYIDIPKFGLVVGLFSALFKLARCLLNRHCKGMHPRLKAFLAGVLCSFSLSLATQGE